MSDPASLFKYLQNEEPMDSPLNSAHSSSRRADRHMKHGRYDEAIKCHSEAVDFLKKAIAESTIPKNVESLQLQCEYHENIQQIIGRKKLELADFLRRRNGLNANDKALDQPSKEGKIKFCRVGDLKIDEKDLNDDTVHVKEEESVEDDYVLISLEYKSNE